MEMGTRIRKAIDHLIANNFTVHFAKTGETACGIILDMISKDDIVGIGDSATVRQIGILNELEKIGTMTLNPFSRKLTTDPSKREMRYKISRDIFTSDVLITGANAVTVDGKIVNMDAVGNRVAAMIFGPKRVIIVVGRNKIVENVEEALHRIRHVIAPCHAKTKEFGTPCVHTGICSDCSSKSRICNVTTIMEKRPWQTDTAILLIDDDLGLGWDEKWEDQRISKIRANYEKATWVFAST